MFVCMHACMYMLYMNISYYFILLYVLICIHLHTYKQTCRHRHTLAYIHVRPPTHTHKQARPTTSASRRLRKSWALPTLSRRPLTSQRRPRLPCPKLWQWLAWRSATWTSLSLTKPFRCGLCLFIFFLSCSLLSACSPACPVVTVCVRIVYLYACIHACIYTYSHTCIEPCLQASMYALMHILRTYIHIMYIRTRTYSHTHAHAAGSNCTPADS